MMINSVNGSTANVLASGSNTGFAALGQADFIKLMTSQLQQQDPFEPVDNKEMLAQMAQFSSLAGIDGVNTTLKQISTKLDAVLASQAAAKTAA
jgi:flagellar basal-body rod modification protein FlgD